MGDHPTAMAIFGAIMGGREQALSMSFGNRYFA
jgi:hypothetical protein